MRGAVPHVRSTAVMPFDAPPGGSVVVIIALTDGLYVRYLRMRGGLYTVINSCAACSESREYCALCRIKKTGSYAGTVYARGVTSGAVAPCQRLQSVKHPIVHSIGSCVPGCGVREHTAS